MDGEVRTNIARRVPLRLRSPREDQREVTMKTGEGAKTETTAKRGPLVLQGPRENRRDTTTTMHNEVSANTITKRVRGEMHLPRKENQKKIFIKFRTCRRLKLTQPKPPSSQA